MITWKKRDWLKGLAFVLFLFSFPAAALADWVDVMRKFQPRISLMEEYTDNLFYTKTNTVDDFITTISPGLTFSSSPMVTSTPSAGPSFSSAMGPSSSSAGRKEPKYGLDLDYAPGFVFYAHNSNFNYISHSGTLNAWYTFGRNFTLRLWDNVIQSKNPLEGYAAVPQQPQPPGIYYPAVNQNGYTYLRNIVSPSLIYQFGREDLIELNFTDNYYHSQNPGVGTILLDSVTPRFTYWFTINHGIVLEYTYMTGRYDFQPDFTGHRTRGRYTYRFDAQTSIFAQYIYDNLNYDSPGVDYYVNSPSVGITHAFSPTLTGRAQVGYFLRNPEQGKSTSGPTVDLGINQRTMRTTLDLSLLGGYSADLSSAQTLGFFQYYLAIGRFSYELAARTSVGFFGSVGWYDYADQGRKDWIWRTEGNFSYQPLRWLTTSFVVYHQEDDSDLSTVGYKENRAMVRLTATYW
jgi:hypothetical protein